MIVFALMACAGSKKQSDEQCKDSIQHAWNYQKEHPHLKISWDENVMECFNREHLIEELKEKDSISEAH